MYRWVKEYVGIPFLSGGRDRNGCDCYGIVRLILLEQYGISLPLLSGNYTDALNPDETRILFKQNIPILCGTRIDSPSEKAVALIRQKGLLCHVGLYAGDGYIIHERHSTGAVCERIKSPRLAGCVEGWYNVSQSYGTAQSVLCEKDGTFV